MGLTKYLWMPKQKQEYWIHDINFNVDKMILEIRFDNKISKLEKKIYTLILVERKKHVEVSFKGELVEENIINVEINNNKTKEFLENGIWDAYIKIKSSNTEEKVRVKNRFIENGQSIPYFIKNNNKFLLVYSTIKGNLSFRNTNSIIELNTEKVSLSNKGILKISGYIFIPSWDVGDSSLLEKTILIVSKNKKIEREFPITSKNMRKDITKRYGYSGMNYDWTGFEIEIDFRDNNYDFEVDVPFQFFVKVEYENKTVVKPIAFDQFEIDNKEALVETSEGFLKAILKIDSKDNSLFLLLTKEEMQAEVNTIYSEDGELTVSGELQTTNSTVRRSNEVFVLLKKRNNIEEHRIKLLFNEKFNFDIILNLQRLIQKEIISEGIWDLFLEVNNHKIRLVTRRDGVENKQQIISIPQQVQALNKGTAVVIKPYYTLYDEVSILVRSYIAFKSIEDVKLESSNLIIRGKLNIQPPNDDVLTHLNGKIKIKGLYGKTYDLSVNWNLIKTNKTRLEFEFKAVADINALNKSERENLIRDINFDLIQCEINMGNMTAYFTMPIDPVKVILTVEDRMKQNTKIKRIINKVGKKLYKFYNNFLPVSSKMVIFQSFHGKSYACNPKAIYESLLNSKKNIKTVWVMNNLKQEIPGNSILVRPHSLKYYYYMARSKYFVNNGNFPDFYEKRKGAVHLQTWHGTPLKKLGFDIDVNSPSYLENTSPELLRRNERWDYLIGPNDYTTEILKRAFKYKNCMLEVGYPRNDLLLLERDKQNKIIEIKKKLNIKNHKKVILYAPTWRDYDFHKINKREPYEFKFDLNKFNERFGDEYVLLLRLHYRDAARINLSDTNQFVYNVSSYDDIQELYLISDILITDYSSVMFDYANLNRPMIFFTYDLKRYGSEIRGFYFNFQKEAPGPIVLNENQLFNEIENLEINQKNYEDKYKRFKEKFCHLEDGKASQRIVNTVFKDLIK